MRTTPSRFSAFVAAVDPNLEGRPATINATVASNQLSVIEQKHPAVMRALTLLWGFPEMNQYFEKVASGMDPSLNLEPAAMAELMLLSAVHQRVCPYRPAKTVEELYGEGRWADPWKPARPRL